MVIDLYETYRMMMMTMTMTMIRMRLMKMKIIITGPIMKDDNDTI